MNLYIKDMEPIGFKSNNILISVWSRYYHKVLPSRRVVYVVDALNEMVMHFELSKKQFKEFMNGKLSLVPIGCCNAIGGDYIDNPTIDFKGEFKRLGSKKKIIEYLKDLTSGIDE